MMRRQWYRAVGHLRFHASTRAPGGWMLGPVLWAETGVLCGFSMHLVWLFFSVEWEVTGA
jgi:hypothetical protein